MITNEEIGTLNDFLEAAPGAEPLCSMIAKMVSVDDIALRPTAWLGKSKTNQTSVEMVFATNLPFVLNET